MSDETEGASQDDIDSMFDESSETEGKDGTDDGENAPTGASMDLNEIEEDPNAHQENKKNFAVGEPMAGEVAAIYDIPVQISAVLGRSTMQVSQLLKLGRGAVVELDRKVGEAIDIYVNNRLVARGEVVVVEDKLGITMTEIVKSDRA
jgi:flagellar motor switch protein FliN/FliY